MHPLYLYVCVCAHRIPLQVPTGDRFKCPQDTASSAHRIPINGSRRRPSCGSRGPTCGGHDKARFEAFPMSQQIPKIEPRSDKGSPKRLRLFDCLKFLGWSGPLDQLKKGPFDRKTIQKGSRHGDGPKAWRIYIYIYIYIYIQRERERERERDSQGHGCRSGWWWGLGRFWLGCEIALY
jgi:hypothetical protein